MLKRPDNYLGGFFTVDTGIGLVEYIKVVEVKQELFRTYVISFYDDGLFQIGEQYYNFDNAQKEFVEITQQEFNNVIVDFHEQTKQMTLRWTNGNER
jgi:hypothetical protein